MSANPRFSTCSMAAASGLVADSALRPPHAVRSRVTKGIDRMKQPIGAVTVVTYREEFRAAFEELNRDWIETHFVLEEADREVFSDPEAAVLATGGQIFFVLEGDDVQGTCA